MSYWSRSPSNTCNMYISWIHSEHENEHMYLAEYRSENVHWSNMDPKLKGFLEISAAAATGAVIGLVAGPIGSLIGAVGGAIGGLVAVVAGIFGHRHKDKGEDGESGREHEERLRHDSLARRDRVKCIESYLDEHNEYADSGRDSRYVTSNSTGDRYQGSAQQTGQGYWTPGPPPPPSLPASAASCR
jgi:hypothetical protein